MRELNKRFLLGLDVTRRKEYREHIAHLTAVREELNNELAYTKETLNGKIKEAESSRDTWRARYEDMKRSHDALLKGRDAINEQVKKLREEKGKLHDELVNAKCYVEKSEAERSAALDRVEVVEEKAKSAVAEAKRVTEAYDALVGEMSAQREVYLALARDYQTLSDDYDALRTSIAITKSDAVEDEPMEQEVPAQEAVQEEPAHGTREGEAPNERSCDNCGVVEASDLSDFDRDGKVMEACDEADETPCKDMSYCAPEDHIADTSVAIAEVEDDSIVAEVEPEQLDVEADNEPLPSSPYYEPERKKSKRNKKHRK